MKKAAICFTMCLFLKTSVCQIEPEVNRLIKDAVSYMDKEEYLSAMDLLLNAERVINFNKINITQMGDVYLYLANCYDYYYFFDIAKEYYQKAFRHYLANNNHTGIAYYFTYMGDMLEDEGHNEQAMDYQKIALKKFDSLLHYKGVAMVYDNMSSIYENYQKYDSSLYCLTQALDIYVGIKDSSGLCVVLNNFGDIYRRKNNYARSISYYLKSLEIAKKVQNQEEERGNLKDLARIYAEVGNYKQAYQMFEQFFERHRSLKIEKKLQEISRIQVRNLEENNAMELQAVIDDKKIQQLTYLSVTLTLLVIIGIILGIYFTYRYRTAKKLSQEERDKIVLQKELELRKQKLLDYTQQLSERAEKIEDLKRQLEKAFDKENISESARYKALEKLSYASILTDDDWKNFKKQFEAVYPGFFTKIKDQYPDFSTGDARLAAILKLKLPQEDIAHMMGISPDSVKKAKSRLKKKISDDENFKLKDWVDSL